MASGSFRKSLIKAIPNLFLCLPFLILSILFIVNREAPTTDDFFSASTLWALFVKLKIFVLYGSREEQLISQVIFYLIALFFASSFIFKGALSKGRHLWLFLPLILLAMFFFMPDVSSNGSFISQRLLIFAFWFLLLFLCQFRWGKWLNVSVILFVIIIQGVRTFSFEKEIRKQNILVDEFEKAATFIEPNAIVLDIWKGKHFSDRHYSAYLGYNKPLVLLDNYEAHYGYFPIKWNDDLPKVSLAGSSFYDAECVKWISNEGSELEKAIDYVVVWGDKEPKPCEKEVQEILNTSYQQLYRSDNNYLRLYVRKGALRN